MHHCERPLVERSNSTVHSKCTPLHGSLNLIPNFNQTLTLGITVLQNTIPAPFVFGVKPKGRPKIMRNIVEEDFYLNEEIIVQSNISLISVTRLIVVSGD